MAADDVKRARRERMQWIEDVLASDLPDELKVLAVRYGLHKNDHNGRCDPSEPGLAKGTHKSERTIRKQRPKLRELGWIAYADNKGGRSKDGDGKRTQVELTKPGHSYVPLKGGIKAPIPGHSCVPLAGQIKGDVSARQGGHVHDLYPDIAVSPEPIEPIEPGRAAARAPLVEGSLSRPQGSKQERKEGAAEEGRKQEKASKINPELVADMKSFLAEFKARSKFKADPVPKVEVDRRIPLSALPGGTTRMSAPPAVETPVVVPAVETVAAVPDVPALAVPKLDVQSRPPRKPQPQKPPPQPSKPAVAANGRQAKLRAQMLATTSFGLMGLLSAQVSARPEAHVSLTQSDRLLRPGVDP